MSTHASEPAPPGGVAERVLQRDDGQKEVPAVKADAASQQSEGQWNKDWSAWHTSWCSRDTERYRQGYPELRDDPTANKNLAFYSGQQCAEPEHVTIDAMLAWKGRFDHLEYCHSYIQWLFPIREQGLNSYAQILQPHEIVAMKADPAIMQRVHLAYRMMLDFWGMEVDDDTTGKLKKSSQSQRCFHNLNLSSHNYLRITRMLKFLGELGLENYKIAFLEFCEDQIFNTMELANCRRSFEDYWVQTVYANDVREAFIARCKAYPPVPPRYSYNAWWTTGSGGRIAEGPVTSSEGPKM